MDTPTAVEYLKDQVKLKVGLIGIGNAGNQLINTAFSEGYSVFAINSSERDLSELNVNSEIPAFIVGNEARGAGKNREKAKDLFRINGKKIFDVPAFDELVQFSDIIFVIASTAGGTGSGIAPDLIRILTALYPNKIIIFYGIMPKISDSIIAQNNSINCLNEILILKIPFMMADLSFYENIPNDIAYIDIGKHMLESINVIKGKYLYQTSNNSIDENDMRVIVSEPGYMAVYIMDRVTSAQLNTETIQSMMIKQIKNSPAMMLQKDEIIKQLGVIVNCPDEIMESSKTGNYSELIKFIGVPLGIFENYTITTKSSGQFIIILSGMTIPYSRLQLSIQIIEEHEAKLKRVKEIDLTGDVDRFNFLNQRSNNSKITDNVIAQTKGNKESVLNDFFPNKSNNK